MIYYIGRGSLWKKSIKNLKIEADSAKRADL